MVLDLAHLLEPQSLNRLEEGEARLVIAARLWVGLRKRGADPNPAIALRLGSDAAAWRFWLLMEEVGTAWPEPFLVSPPCCSRMTMDEAALCDMLRAAGEANKAGFVQLLEDLLPLELAERLYNSAGAFLDSMVGSARESGSVSPR